MPATALNTPAITGALDLNFAEMSQRVRRLYAGARVILTLAVVAGGIAILQQNPSWIASYLLISGSSLALVWLWTSAPRQGLPLLPIFAVQHLVIYALPFVIQNKTVQITPVPVLLQASLGFCLFLGCCWGGRAFGQGLIGRVRPSRWNLSLAEGRNAAARCFSLSFVLLTMALLFYVTARAGWLFTLLPADLFPLLRTFATAAAMLGGMLGALVIGKLKSDLRQWLFWALIIAICLLSVADVLVSGASGVVIAVMLGLALGSRRLPWKFLVITFAIIGVLNQGKFVMRARYWDKDSGSTVTMTQLPAFFREWISASWEVWSNGEEQTALDAVADGTNGQSILDRIDNLQNLTFIIERLEPGDIQTLHGETYTLIPKLLIPRLFWADKPRAHEGQILLNLHYGRQTSVEDTEKTYIAWGLLPEAVGNFGILWGPIIVGSLLGIFIGLIEAYSLRIRLFSIEGIVLLGLLLQVAGSYEMVASVLVTSTFQFLVASLASGILLYSWFKGSRNQAAPWKSKGLKMRLAPHPAGESPPNSHV
ncbi:MAG: hypothetical protein ABIT76_00750 [Chthoniobacterales bacterium]